MITVTTFGSSEIVRQGERTLGFVAAEPYQTLLIEGMYRVMDASSKFLDWARSREEALEILAARAA